jgi:hypothetical protein
VPLPDWISSFRRYYAYILEVKTDYLLGMPDNTSEGSVDNVDMVSTIRRLSISIGGLEEMIEEIRACMSHINSYDEAVQSYQQFLYTPMRIRSYYRRSYHNINSDFYLDSEFYAIAVSFYEHVNGDTENTTP